MMAPIVISPQDAEFEFRTKLAEALFEDDWQKASGARDPTRTRRGLRDRAWEILETARRMTSVAEVPNVDATPKPENVEVATEKDAAGLLALIQESDRELAVVSRNYDKVRDVIGLAVDRTPIMDEDGSPFMRPVFGVVLDDAAVVAACGLFPTQPWDSLEFYLRGFFLYVGNASRRTNHGKSLLQFGSWFGDRTEMPVVWEVMNCRVLDERSRMFARHAMPLGGLFLHRPVEKVAA